MTNLQDAVDDLRHISDRLGEVVGSERAPWGLEHPDSPWWGAAHLQRATNEIAHAAVSQLSNNELAHSIVNTVEAVKGELGVSDPSYMRIGDDPEGRCLAFRVTMEPAFERHEGTLAVATRHREGDPLHVEPRSVMVKALSGLARDVLLIAHTFRFVPNYLPKREEFSDMATLTSNAMQEFFSRHDNEPGETRAEHWRERMEATLAALWVHPSVYALSSNLLQIRPELAEFAEGANIEGLVLATHIVASALVANNIADTHPPDAGATPVSPGIHRWDGPRPRTDYEASAVNSLLEFVVFSSRSRLSFNRPEDPAEFLRQEFGHAQANLTNGQLRLAEDREKAGAPETGRLE